MHNHSKLLFALLHVSTNRGGDYNEAGIPSFFNKPRDKRLRNNHRLRLAQGCRVGFVGWQSLCLHKPNNRRKYKRHAAFGVRPAHVLATEIVYKKGQCWRDVNNSR